MIVVTVVAAGLVTGPVQPAQCDNTAWLKALFCQKIAEHYFTKQIANQHQNDERRSGNILTIKVIFLRFTHILDHLFRQVMPR